MTTVLHMFPHGLGDSAQFTAVLKHLARYRPTWVQDVLTFNGQHTTFNGLVRNAITGVTWEELEPKYDISFIHNWWECYESWPDSPGTKTVACIRNVFGLQPEWDLLSYIINIGPEAHARADAYVKTLPPRSFALLHYEGSSEQSNKNLSHETAREICNILLQSHITPVILDWNGTSPLPDQKLAFRPGKDNALWSRWGTGDSETIAALISRAAIYIGIDSGPQKIAMATGTPVIALWVANHPYHFADNTATTVHLVPENHMDYLRGDKAAAAQFFNQNYWFVTYPPHRMVDVLRGVAQRFIPR